jgi:hypothetical protein
LRCRHTSTPCHNKIWFFCPRLKFDFFKYCNAIGEFFIMNGNTEVRDPALITNLLLKHWKRKSIKITSSNYSLRNKITVINGEQDIFKLKCKYCSKWYNLVHHCKNSNNLEHECWQLQFAPVRTVPDTLPVKNLPNKWVKNWCRPCPMCQCLGN